MKKLILASLFLLFSLSFAEAEGTREVRPTATSGGQISVWDWGGEFATYNAPAERRLHVSVKDHTNEQVYLGFNSIFSGMTYIRIKDSNGNIVWGPHELKKNNSNFPGWIPNYNAAVAGPLKVNPAGYKPLTFNPTSNGDFIIEINPGDPIVKDAPSPGNVRRYDLFDVTVVDTVSMIEKRGRLWSKLWALTTNGQGILFDAEIFVLREDSTRYLVDYNGMDAFGFGIISNDNGCTSTGDAIYDRQSRSFTPSPPQGTVTYYPQHKLFLNPPDTDIWPFPLANPTIALPADTTNLITGCNTTGYCINVNATASGFATVELNLDGVPGIQMPGMDRVITALIQSGANCIPWDGLTGTGGVAQNGVIGINIEYQASVINIPIWDCETYSNGILFYHIQNTGVRNQLPLFWDDAPVGQSTNLTGCLNPIANQCRFWGTAQGNERFMNTWSSAFVSTTNLANVNFQGCRPTAIRDVAFVNQSDSIFILPFLNDQFPSTPLNPNTFVFLSLPLNGQVSYNLTTEEVKYKPLPAFIGVDSARYQICDQGTPSICTTAWMVFNVIDVNVPPVINLINGNPPDQNIPVQTNEDTPVTICFDVSDIDGDNISLTAVSLPSNGTVTGLNVGDTCFLYTPNADYFGPDTVVINVCDDGLPIRCTQVSVPITVLPVNDKPNIVAVGNQPTVNDTVYHITPEDVAKVLCLIIVDVDLGQTGNIPSVTRQVPGSNFQVNPQTGCPVYTPAPNYNGVDTLRVVFCDDGVPSLCDTTYIIMTITPVNDKPIAMPDQDAVDPGDTVCINPLLNDIDVDGNPLSFIVIGTPSFGTYSLAGDSLCYTPLPGILFGIDSIYYRVCDNGSPVRCDTGLIRIFIPSGPYPPTAVTDNYTLNEDQPYTFDPLLNDFDANQDPVFLLYPPVTPPVNGIVSQSGNQWTYIPFNNFCGEDSLEYQIFDGTGLNSTGWVYFTVLCIGDKPVALNPQGLPTPTLTYNVFEDTQAILCMDLDDADGNAVDVTGVYATGTVPAQVSGLADGDSCFTFIPDPDYFGTIVLNFIICDDANPSLCDTIVTTINVAPVNDAPIARPDADTTTAGTQKIISVISNDTDIDGQINPSSITLLSPPSNGTATANQINATLIYTPAAGFTGLDTLIYRICDNGTPLPAQCDTAMVLIRVVPRDFTLSSYAGYCENNIAKLSWAITDLNFPAGTTNPLTIFWLDQGGTVISTNTNLPLSGNIIWPGMALDINQNPIDWPGWLLQGGQWVQGVDGYEGLRPQATVVFSINPSDTVVVNYPVASTNCSANPAAEPIANNDTVTVPNSAITNINAIANDISPLGRPISITAITSGPFLGSATIQSGQLAYTPLSGYCGPDSLIYQICDNGGLCSTAWVYLNVQQVDADNDGLNDAYETTTRDTDGDGRRDYLDPDSDDDGMSDQFESRRIGNDCDFTTQDWDNDGVPDWRDLDSDNDGITDFIERSTTIVLNDNQDLDNDGIDDAYDPSFGGYLETSPVDTDGDGSPDYLDLDSDNDGIKDYEEGFLLPNYPRGQDSDNDGLDDSYESNLGGLLGLAPSDTDGDGIPDWRDPDSDNDGLADGPNDPFDSDCNDNGIPDFRDPTPCNIFIPAGLSPNGDNSNDVFFIGNLENYPNNYLQVFNRWGIKVYQSETPYDNAWDGVVNEGSAEGNILPSGVYYYILHLRNDDSIPPMTGSLTLITD